MYNINRKIRRHIIRDYFGFNLLRSASKLKRGVIDETDGIFRFLCSWIFLPHHILLVS